MGLMGACAMLRCRWCRAPTYGLPRWTGWCLLLPTAYPPTSGITHGRPASSLGPLTVAVWYAGLDNHPWRSSIRPDSTDHPVCGLRTWAILETGSWTPWNFGDGTCKDATESPYHLPSISRRHHVCLPAGNAEQQQHHMSWHHLRNGSSTDISQARQILHLPELCRGLSRRHLGEYVPAMEKQSYDISGHSVPTQRLYYGQNNIDAVAALGIYLAFYRWQHAGEEGQRVGGNGDGGVNGLYSDTSSRHCLDTIVRNSPDIFNIVINVIQRS